MKEYRVTEHLLGENFIAPSEQWTFVSAIVNAPPLERTIWASHGMGWKRKEPGNIFVVWERDIDSPTPIHFAIEVDRRLVARCLRNEPETPHQGSLSPHPKEATCPECIKLLEARAVLAANEAPRRKP